MKKGLINMICLVLVLVNLVLTGLLAFAIIPTMQSSNAVIKKIASIIDLEIADSTDDDTLAVDQVAVHNVQDKMTITLKDDGSGQNHYAVVYASIYFDKNNENFEAYYADIATQEPQIKSNIDQVVSSYTYAELDKNIAAEEIKELLNRDFYKTDIVYKVVFTSFTMQ